MKTDSVLSKKDIYDFGFSIAKSMNTFVLYIDDSASYYVNTPARFLCKDNNENLSIITYYRYDGRWSIVNEKNRFNFFNFWDICKKDAQKVYYKQEDEIIVMPKIQVPNLDVIFNTEGKTENELQELLDLSNRQINN